MDIKSALIVDDSKMARITLKKQLEGRGISISLAESGEESIDFLKQNHPDVIFMDCLMPGIDGFEATRQILANPDTSDIPVVLCTGKESEEDKQKASDLGAAGYITKSSSPEPLIAILDELSSISPEAATAPASMDTEEITQIAEAAASKIALNVSHEIAGSIAEKVAEEISLKHIAAASAEQAKQVNDNISALAEQLESKVIFSVKSSLKEVHTYIDSQIETIKPVNVPEFKDSITSLVTESIEKNNQQFLEEVDKAKTEISQPLKDLSNTMDAQIENINQVTVPEIKAGISDSITEAVEKHNQQLAEDFQQLKAEFNQLSAQKDKLELLQQKVDEKSASNSMGIIALLSGIGALLISVYVLLQ